MHETKRFLLLEMLIVLTLLVSCDSQVHAAEKQSEDCQKKAAVIKVGMTRGEIEARMEHDGGVAGIYKGERLFFADTREEPGKDWAKKQYCMLTIDFHPYGLPDEIYRDVNHFAEWVKTVRYHPDVKDTAVNISAPFTDYQHFD